MTPTPLVSLTYASRPQPGLGLPAVMELVLAAARKNHELEISGALWFHERLFVQTIEGAPEAIDALFARICEDERHSAVTLCERKSIDARTYRDWGMTLVELEQPDATVEEVASRIVGLAVSLDEGDEACAAPAADRELVAQITALLP